MTDSHTTPDVKGSASASVDDAWRAVCDATQGAYEVLAEIARDVDGAVAFVGRPVGGGELVILKLEREPGTEGPPRYTLFELKRLDDTVPAPRISCPVCSAQVATWRGRCPACSSIIGAGTDGPLASEVLVSFYRFVSATYDVVGEIAVEGSGPPAYLVRTRGEQHFVILRLSSGGTVPDGSAAFAVDVLPLAAAGETAAAPTRVPLQIAAPSSSTSTPTAAPVTNPERVCPQCGSLFGAGTLFCPRDGASLRLVSTGGDLIGQLIDDRYYIEQRLGEGGMGEVYIAHQVRTGRKCALKLMHRTMTQDPDAVGRFRREAASACAISHPNVATIFDSGETLDQRPYFAMEFVDGRPLSHVIRDEAPLDSWRAADIARQIAEGLAAAHDLEIIHRDLKPDNVMLGTTRTGGDFVKLVDFGIAKPTKGVGNTLTRTGFILGTPAYMSPEQLCADKLDGRSDLYSLGCVLHEMLTGATPFAGQSLELLMMRRLTEPAPHPRALNEQIPPVLDDIAARLLARTADERYADARGAAAALGAAQDTIGARQASSGASSTGGGVRAPTPGPREPSVVTLATSDQKPRRSRDVAPPPPLSPAIPFRAPTLGIPAEDAARTVATAAPAPAARASRWPILAGVAALIVIGGGALEAWRLTRQPAPDADRTTRQPAIVAAPPAATQPPADTHAVVTPAPDSQTRNGRVAAADRPAATNRIVDTPRVVKSAARQTATTSTGRPTTVLQSAAPAPGAGSVAVAPPPLPAPRDTKPVAPAPQTPVIESKPRVDPTVEAERVEAGVVRQSVESYVRAIGAKRMDTLRQLFPGMSEDSRRGYEALFAAASDLSTQLTGTPAISVHGTTADAQFAYDLVGHDPSRGDFTRHFSLRARLQRTDRGWIFLSLDAAP